MAKNPETEAAEDYGLLLMNPADLVENPRGRRRKTPPRGKGGRFRRRKSAKRRRRRNPANPVLVRAAASSPPASAANPRRRRRSRGRSRIKRRSRRRNPAMFRRGGFVGNAMNTLGEAGAFLVGDLAGTALVNFVWRNLKFGQWIERQQWAKANPDMALGLGQIAIGLISDPLLKMARIPSRWRRWIVLSNVFAGALTASAKMKGQILKPLNLDGLGDYLSVPSDEGMGDYLSVPGNLGATDPAYAQMLPSDRDVDASFGHGWEYS